MAGEYRSFSELAKKKREGTHWRVVSRDRESSILVAAPHGGRAEPHTSGIAKTIAGAGHSLYVFEALAAGLHITSHRFNEPRAIELARRHTKVLTVHGCDNTRSGSVDIFVGGLDSLLRNVVIAELRSAGFEAAIDKWTPGRAQSNICNAGTSASGVQLEITRRLRNRLGSKTGGQALRRKFAKAVRRALKNRRTGDAVAEPPAQLR
jgi:phage replication-related protein YjqB (UPF0714/DUF867 family)